MTTFWQCIMCALGACLGSLAAHLIIEHEKDERLFKPIGKLIEEMDDPNFFTNNYGEDGREWDVLRQRTKKVHSMIPRDELWKFSNEIIAAGSLEEKNEVCDKWEAKYNNKEEQEK